MVRSTWARKSKKKKSVGRRRNARAHLLLKVTDGKVVCISEKVKKLFRLQLALQVVHQVCPVALFTFVSIDQKPPMNLISKGERERERGTEKEINLDLLISCDGTEGDLDETLFTERTEADTTNNVGLLQE